MIKFEDSRHIQVAIYTVVDEESEFQLKNSKILEPGGKTYEKRIETKKIGNIPY